MFNFLKKILKRWMIFFKKLYYVIYGMNEYIGYLLFYYYIFLYIIYITNIINYRI